MLCQRENGVHRNLLKFETSTKVGLNMSRLLRVGAAQVGPIYKDEAREAIVERLIVLMEEAAHRKVDLVCYPEGSLSTWFPRFDTDLKGVERYFDKAMPNPSVQPLFDRAKELGIGFHLGYAELDGDKPYNTSILTNKEGKIIAKYRKSHIPGTSAPKPGDKFHSLEQRFFLKGDTGFKVWPAYGGNIGMLICNDRRWPEAWRVLGLRGVALVITGWNTRRARLSVPDSRFYEFHNKLALQAGCYQNCTWAVGVAHCGEEESGYVLMGKSMIVNPFGEVIAMSYTIRDELIDATIDLDEAKRIKSKSSQWAVDMRRPDFYKPISESDYGLQE